jgi:transposase
VPSGSRRPATVNLLNWPHWEVRRLEEEEHAYELTVALKRRATACLHCGVADQLERFGTQHPLFLDLPIHGKQVALHVVRQRYRCRACGRTFPEPLADMDERHATTKRLASYVQREALRRTFVSVADEVGLAESTVRRIFTEHTQALDEARPLVTPAWLGIDEIHLGGRPRCVLANVQQRTILDLLRDRNRSTVVAFLLGLADTERVELVAMDMWRPYKEAVNAVLLQSTIVVDKFHVLRLANAALEAIRKEHRSRLTRAQRRRLMHDRFLLLKRRRDLTPQEQWVLESWTLGFPTLAQAYQAKEDFYGMWDLADRQVAKEAYGAWTRQLPRDLEPAFRELTTAMSNWDTEILAHVDHPITNAYTESLNNLIRLTNRIGRGYSFTAIRAKLLYAETARKRPGAGLLRFSMKGAAELPRAAADADYGADLPLLIKRLGRRPP